MNPMQTCPKSHPFPETGRIEIAPSILSADFARLYDAVATLKAAGCLWVHCDVMDNHFVPNLTFGAPVVKSLTAAMPEMFYDVHLMIDAPEKWIPDFVKAKSDCITFHTEAAKDPQSCIRAIKDAGILAGISIKPATPVDTIVPLLPLVDMVLVMTVEPGFGGQGMIPSCLDKLKTLQNLRARNNWNYAIQADGGINAETAALTVQSGAEILVAGSAVFNTRPVCENIRHFEQAIAPTGKSLTIRKESCCE